MEKNNYIEGSISKGILRLTWPVMISMALELTFSVVDAIWVGRLGAAAIAALSTAGFIIWSLHSMSLMISVGINAMVARYIGAKQYDNAVYTASQGLRLTFLGSCIVTVLGILFCPVLFKIMGTDQEVTAKGILYMNIIFGGSITMFVFYSIESIFRASGDTKTPMKILALAVFLNIAFDPILIFGFWFVPRLEVAGAAIATISSHLIAVVVAGILLRNRFYRKYQSEPDKQITPLKTRMVNLCCCDFKVFFRILKVGIPTSAAGFMFCFVYMLLTRVTSGFGTVSVAALGIGHKVETLSYLSAVAFSAAAATMVGQNMGAKRLDRAEKSAWISVEFVSVITFLSGSMMFLFPEHLVRIFINNDEVVRIGTAYLKILSISQLFMGLEIVLEGAFGGAGNTIPPMIISIPLSFARIPFAYWFAFNLSMGVNGVWWAICLTSIVRGSVMAFWFRKNHWKSKKI